MTGQRLCEAALDGDAAKVSTLLSTQGARSFINYQDARGCTPLLFAARNGHSAITEKLLAACCSVDLVTEDGCTALQSAAGNGHEAVTKQLIAARCNVDLQANNGCTALYFAAVKGMWLFRNSSFQHAVTSIFRTRMVARRSTSQPVKGKRSSRSS